MSNKFWVPQVSILRPGKPQPSSSAQQNAAPPQLAGCPILATHLFFVARVGNLCSSPAYSWIPKTKTTSRFCGWWPESCTTTESGSSGPFSRAHHWHGNSHGGNRRNAAHQRKKARIGADKMHDVETSKTEDRGQVKKPKGFR